MKSEELTMIKCRHKNCSLLTEDGHCCSTITKMCGSVPDQFYDPSQSSTTPALDERWETVVEVAHESNPEEFQPFGAFASDNELIQEVVDILNSVEFRDCVFRIKPPADGKGEELL